MAGGTVIKKLVTKWSYEVDAKQLLAAERQITNLQKAILQTLKQSDKLAAKEAKNMLKMSTNYNKLTASLNKFKRARAGMEMSGRGGGGGFFGRGGGRRGGGGGGGRSGSTSTRFGASGLSLMGFGLGGLATVGLSRAVSKVVTLGAGFEAAQSNFATMLGSQKKANELLTELNRFAARTPFEITKLRDNAKTIIASGFDASEVKPMLQQLGDISQGDSAVLRRMVINLSEIKNNNKASIRDIRQFVTAGVDIMSALEKVTGQDKATINQMISKNQITFDIVKKALNTLTGKGGTFFNSMAAKSNTLTGKFSNLVDNLTLIAEDAGKGSLNDQLKGIVDDLNIFLSGDDRAKKIATFLGDMIGSIVTDVTSLPALVTAIREGLATIFGEENADTVFGLMAGALIAIKAPILAIALAVGDIATYLKYGDDADTITGEIFEGLGNIYTNFQKALGMDADSLAMNYNSTQLKKMMNSQLILGDSDKLRFQKAIQIAEMKEAYQGDIYNKVMSGAPVIDPKYGSPPTVSGGSIVNQNRIEVNINGADSDVARQTVDAIEERLGPTVKKLQDKN